VSQPGPEVPSGIIRATKALTPNPIAKAAHAKVGETFLIAQLGGGPDLGVTSLASTAPYLTGGATLPVTVKIENFGQSYVPATDLNYTLVATWDGPEGTDDPVLSQTVTALASNATQTLQLAVPVPAAFRADDVHTLFVTLRPDAAVEEANAIDNERMVSFGAMPIPTKLMITTEPGQPIVFVNWTLDGPADPRVAGYRVMLVDDAGNRKALGSTPVMGFADLAGAIGETRRYVVTSYSANGVESAESEIIVGVPAPAAVEPGATSLLSDGFEGP